MAPHINRARIVLVVVGVLYAFVGWRSYSDISKLHDMVNHLRGHDGDPQLEKLKSAVSLAYGIVIFVIIAGVANIVLAAIAGKKTMLAFNAAAVIFILLTCAQAYASSGLVFTSILWWLTAICLGMGYTAARKAEKLRAGA